MTSPQINKAGVKLLALACLVGGAFINTGCEKAEDRTIAEAKECIDHAVGATAADACVAKISGIESEQAYLIRCSAHFIAQDFTSTRLANAFDKMKANTSNSTASAMAFFVFTNTSTAHSADVAYAHCEKAGVRSMSRLATMAKMATVIADTGLSGALTALTPENLAANPAAAQTAIQTAITSIVTEIQNNPTGPTAVATTTTIGTVAQQASTAYCNEGSSFASNDVCKKLQSAITNGAGDPAAIGAELMALLNTH